MLITGGFPAVSTMPGSTDAPYPKIDPLSIRAHVRTLVIRRNSIIAVYFEKQRSRCPGRPNDREMGQERSKLIHSQGT